MIIHVKVKVTETLACPHPFKLPCSSPYLLLSFKKGEVEQKGRIVQLE